MATCSLRLEGGFRKLNIHEGAGGRLSRFRLRSLCAERGWLEPDRIFRTIETPRKTSQCVSPVFFGQADACGVIRSDFETLQELNPQLKTQLKVLASSDPHVEARIGRLRPDARSWRDIQICLWTVYFICCPKEIDCPTHGRLQETIPWADGHARVTKRKGSQSASSPAQEQSPDLSRLRDEG